ncbi:MAG TPA: ABC transporter ATP-binding protein [Bacillales bacterium]|nr:ABC transporter ATP-binding protein [Bacillales bacterium]
MRKGVGVKMPPIYEVKNLEKTYKKGKVKANKNISFTVNKGEILGVFGPNGAGKSTLIKQMVGHIRPTKGDIWFRGNRLFEQTARVAEQVAYYAQEPYAMEKLKVSEAIKFTGRLRGMTKADADEAGEWLIERLKLTNVRHKLLRRVSGGQKRLVGIAAALIGHMEVLILDEPTNELDPENRRLVWNLILESNKERGVTVLLVTHNVLEAEQVVDRVMMVDKGELLAIDTVGNLKNMVDQRLRIEVTSAFGKRKVAEDWLRRRGEIEVVSENRFRLFIDKQQAGETVQEMVENSEQMACEEYKLLPPSLEDVYFHLGGREGFEHGK